jgi:murein DD-endopeptidase MepM/ murein hydrolase activator NlpD
MRAGFTVRILAAVFCLGASISAQAQESVYPRIRRLSPADLVFRQIQDAIAQGYRALHAGTHAPDLFLGEWIASASDDLFSLAARLSLPYETLATLNGLSNPRSFKDGERVLIPSMAGIFIAEDARNDLDLLLAVRLDAGETVPVLLPISGGPTLRFYPGVRMQGIERSFFLNVGFRLPLPTGVLTSSYGMRRSPIDGLHRMHDGIDLAAPAGTAVFAARGGQVVQTGDDAVLGIYLILEHEGGWQTVYGHLSSISVMLNQKVLSGTMIGRVGSTGLSTGPHLHFEIRMGGSSRDPSNYLHGLSQ